MSDPTAHRFYPGQRVRIVRAVLPATDRFLGALGTIDDGPDEEGGYLVMLAGDPPTPIILDGEEMEGAP